LYRELIMLSSLASTLGRVASIFSFKLRMVRNTLQKDCILQTIWKQQELQSEPEEVVSQPLLVGEWR